MMSGLLMMGVSLFSTMANSEIASDRPPAFEGMLKIDIHAHVFDDVPEFVDMLRRNNMRIVNVCYDGSKPELLIPAEKQAEFLSEKYRPTVNFASTFDLTHRDEPDYANQVIAWLDESFRAGGCMTKIWKVVGMELKTPQGTYLMPDDPVFDPIYTHLAKVKKPLMAHLADPIDAWRPLDRNSPHYGYYSKHPEWHFYGKEGYPSHADILAARDRMIEKHPDLIVIAAHLEDMVHDLDGLAKHFDRFPNLYADVAARTFELQRLPSEKVREFLVRYQDRLLYGTDNSKYTEGRLPTKEERETFAASMEKSYRRDYEYYAGTGILADTNIQCLGLPRDVLEKFYHGNACRLMPSLGAE